MTKLELQSKYLISRINNGSQEAISESEIEVTNTLKSVACDVANLLNGMKEGNGYAKDLLKEYGISYNGKTKKFS